jgi:hypothetical protein
MDEKPSPAEQLLASVESALAARRATALERARRVELSLESYRRALEAQIVREFAQEHGFKLPAPPATTSERAAELLLAAVQALPELSEPKSEKGARVAGEPPFRPTDCEPRRRSSGCRLPAPSGARGPRQDRRHRGALGA